MPTPKTHEQFCREVYDLVKDDYRVEGVYVKSSQKILMKHTKCGYEWNTAPRDFLAGKRCPKCQHRSYQKTTEEFKAEVHVLVGDEYTIIGEYNGNKEKIKIMHNTCGHEYSVAPSKFLTGRRCPECQKLVSYSKRRKTNDIFVKEVFDLVGDEYKFLEKYDGANKKLKVVHKICGCVYKSSPHNFLTGKRCPSCEESNNEAEIRRYLTKLNVTFETQYKFPDCKYKKPLPFDFVVFGEDKRVIGIVEYDGEFHDTPSRFIKDKRLARVKLHSQKYRDAIKNVYCRAKKIPLLRIHYSQQKDKIQIINDFLNSLNTNIINQVNCL